MPCNCKIPVEKYPETSEWGPLFWKLLHALAEHAGTLYDTLFQEDERRAWIRCIKELGGPLPCDICQQHYSEWMESHDVDFLLTMPYGQFGNWIRDYFWSLHNKINTENEKPVFERTQLKEMYANQAISSVWKTLDPLLKIAMRQYKVSYIKWTTWLHRVRTLQGLYGIS